MGSEVQTQLPVSITDPSPLIEEEYSSLIYRIFWRFVDTSVYLIGCMFTRECLVMFITSMTIVVIVSSFMPDSFLFRRRSHDHSAKPKCKKNNCQTHSQKEIQRINKELSITELKLETYNGMIRLLKPGCRTIILLCDTRTREKLLVEFKKAVWPYRRNKSLLFGYLCLDRNLDWYKALLQQVIAKDLNVIKDNCNGTVLTLNGRARYFHLYHAKHHEKDLYNDGTEDESIMDDADSPESGLIHNDQDLVLNEHVYTVDDLLKRLPGWLEKIFDGATKRYSLEYWPTDMK